MTRARGSNRQSIATSPSRSRLMSRVRRTNTAPEIALRKALFRLGLRFRLSTVHSLPGSPDILFPKARVAVFVDGCFWHGCPTHGTFPKSNSDFWKNKITRNKERDRSVNAKLRSLGWRPVRVWEHDLKKDVGQCARATRAIVLAAGAHRLNGPRRFG